MIANNRIPGGYNNVSHWSHETMTEIMKIVLRPMEDTASHLGIYSSQQPAKRVRIAWYAEAWQHNNGKSFHSEVYMRLLGAYKLKTYMWIGHLTSLDGCRNWCEAARALRHHAYVNTLSSIQSTNYHHNQLHCGEIFTFVNFVLQDRK